MNDFVAGFAIIFFLRFVGTVPLVLVFWAILRSMWEKRNGINGLRRVRILLLIWLGAWILDNVVFMFVGGAELLTGSHEYALLLLTILIDRFILAISSFGIYWMFKEIINKKYK